MASLLPAAVSPYLARLSLPTYAKDAVIVATGLAIVEFWIRIRAIMEIQDESSLFRPLYNWTGYPSAVIASGLAYSTLKNLSQTGATVVSGTLLAAPLLDHAIRNHLQGVLKPAIDKFKNYRTPEEEQNKLAPMIRRNEKINAYLYASSKALQLCCRIGILALSLYFTYKEFSSLTTGGAPLVAAIASGLSAIPLVECLLQHNNENEVITRAHPEQEHDIDLARAFRGYDERSKQSSSST